MPLTLNSVTFLYPTQEKPLFEGLTLTFDKGWTGIVGANGCGKTTLLGLACGKLSPTAGMVKAPGKVLCCAQSTEDPPEGLERILAHQDGPSAELFGRLALCDDWLERWDTLSHGERKRAQIACALVEAPDVLALDEPSNHVDAATRQYLAAALARYRGIGLLVSHDRDLLDRLCRACVLMEHGGVTLRPGTYSQVREQADREAETLYRQKQNAARQHAALDAEVTKRRDVASSADDKRSKRHLDKHDHDGKARVNLARFTGKDGHAGKIMKQLEGRLHQAETRVSAMLVPKRPKLGIELAGEPAAKPLLLRLEEQQLQIGDRTLVLPPIEIHSQDRVGISGPNGAGKSTLLRHILPQFDLPAERVIYLPQEIDAAESAELLARIRSQPHDRLGGLMAAVACLGSDPERLLQTARPSLGEVRKLMLASGLTRKPNLIIMDEPTNHLDLPSIEALEESLAAVRCALILVSHDMTLLRRLCPIRWQIAEGPERCVMSIVLPATA